MNEENLQQYLSFKKQNELFQKLNKNKSRKNTVDQAQMYKNHNNDKKTRYLKENI